MTWMFTYEQLMGEPILRQMGAEAALLEGFHRSFNHESTLLFGNRERPCPVLGLSPGGECWGIAFRAPWTQRRKLLRRLEPTASKDQYLRRRLQVTLRRGGYASALVWVSRPAFTGAAPFANADTEPEVFVSAHGTTGRGVEYVREQVLGLRLWELEDPLLQSVWKRLDSWRPR